LVSGLFFLFYGKNSIKKLSFYDQILLIISVYFISSLFISLPYYLSNYQIIFIDALFESFSGLTSTGFSIFDNIKYLDPTLILWRSSSQWIGGLYFLIFLVIIFSNNQYKFKLNYLVHTGSTGIFSSSNIKTVLFKIFFVYSLLTILIFIILNIADIRLFNSLNLSMTIISNGGFLPTNNLSQIFSDGNKYFLVIVLLIPMLNIFLIFNLFDRKKLINNHQEDLFLVSFVVFLSLVIFFTFNGISLTDILINILSSLSNSGITLTKSVDGTLFFIILCIIGGSLISNSSGIKFLRIYILLKAASTEIVKLVRPNNVFNNNIFYSEKKIDNQTINLSFLIFISFFISLFILSSILVLDNISFENSFKISILTLTNTTNSSLYGLANIDFINFLDSTKFSLIIFMIIGKIELISIFILIRNLLIKD
jgi:trk system potassium uptake protein TrkH